MRSDSTQDLKSPALVVEVGTPIYCQLIKSLSQLVDQLGSPLRTDSFRAVGRCILLMELG